MRRPAVTCVPGDGRLRGLCSVILRHMGYRVHEVSTAAEAARMLESENASVVVAAQAVLDDPELERVCRHNQVTCIRVDSEARIDTLLPLLERRAAPR
jgi:DNA-binding NtrC family response regulator